MSKNKPTRVQFPQGVTKEQILQAIREQQEKWAKDNPQKAHKLYPKIYDEKGNRISQ